MRNLKIPNNNTGQGGGIYVPSIENYLARQGEQNTPLLYKYQNVANNNAGQIGLSNAATGNIQQNDGSSNNGLDVGGTINTGISGLKDLASNAMNFSSQKFDSSSSFARNGFDDAHVIKADNNSQYISQQSGLTNLRKDFSADDFYDKSEGVKNTAMMALGAAGTGAAIGASSSGPAAAIGGAIGAVVGAGIGIPMAIHKKRKAREEARKARDLADRLNSYTGMANQNTSANLKAQANRQFMANANSNQMGFGSMPNAFGGSINRLAYGGAVSFLNAQDASNISSMNALSNNALKALPNSYSKPIANIFDLGGSVPLGMPQQEIAMPQRFAPQQDSQLQQMQQAQQPSIGNSDMIEINNGGTHEENPYQGVPFGVDANGVPNTVEEGEVVINLDGSDFVVSNRLTIPKELQKKYGLRPMKKLSFADAAKIVNDRYDDRPNDPIAQRSKDVILKELAKSQEVVKQQEELKQLLDLSKKLGVAPQTLMALQQQQQSLQKQGALQQQQQSAQQQEMQEQQMAQQGQHDAMLQAIAQQGNPQQEQIMAQQEMPQMPPQQNIAPNQFWKGGLLEDGAKDGRRKYFNLNIPMNNVSYPYDKYRNASQPPALEWYNPFPHGTWYGNPASYELKPLSGGDALMQRVTPLETPAGQQVEGSIAGDANSQENAGSEVDTEAPAENQSFFGKDGRLRNALRKLDYADLATYAPAATNLGGLLYSAISPIDRTNSNAVRAAAEAAGTQKVAPRIGGYIIPDRFDYNTYLNRLASQGAMETQALANMSNGNAATMRSAFLANDRRRQDLLGDAMRNIADYNMKNRLAAAQHNSQINQFNANAILNTNQLNQQSLATRLQGISNAARMDDEYDAAKSSSVSNFASALANDVVNIGVDIKNRRDTKALEDMYAANLHQYKYETQSSYEDRLKNMYEQAKQVGQEETFINELRELNGDKYDKLFE